MATIKPLPTRLELQSRRRPADMIAFARQYLNAGEPNSIDDNAFFLRNRVIKAMVEEYMPLAQYLQYCERQDVFGCLTGEGEAHDGEVHDLTGCIEKIQIVHGTESESEALKRQELAQGNPILKNANYQRNRANGSPEVQSSISQPRKAAELAAQMIIERIENKIAKLYHQIPTLLVSYAETMSTPYTKSSDVIREQVRAWVQAKQKASMAPFSTLVLVSDNGQVVIFELNRICQP